MLCFLFTFHNFSLKRTLLSDWVILLLTFTVTKTTRLTLLKWRLFCFHYDSWPCLGLRSSGLHYSPTWNSCLFWVEKVMIGQKKCICIIGEILVSIMLLFQFTQERRRFMSKINKFCSVMCLPQWSQEIKTQKPWVEQNDSSKYDTLMWAQLISW